MRISAGTFPAFTKTMRGLLFAVLASFSLFAQQSIPGSRTVMDAHNCYPYFEWWSDRIDRALSTGTPLAIEQDLAWHTDERSGRSWSVVTHGQPTSGEELSCHGWFRVYNFGSLEAARVRWRAAMAAHVDYLASDQYELVSNEIREATTTGAGHSR